MVNSTENFVERWLSQQIESGKNQRIVELVIDCTKVQELDEEKVFRQLLDLAEQEARDSADDEDL